jgi:integrase
MGRRIIETTIKKLRPPEQGSNIEWDAQIPGFGVRITAAGVVSFVLSYRIFGRKRNYTIGRWPEWTASAARDEALTLKRRIRDGVDPLEEKHRDHTEPTLDDLAAEYMASDGESKKRPGSVRNDRRMLKAIVCPRLGKMRLKAIGKRDVEALHSLLKETPYQANRVLGLLHTMFNYAIEQEMMVSNPAHKIQKFPEEKRECFLTIEAMQKLHEAIERYPDVSVRDALLLLMLTGSREGEVLKATWEEFDLERGVWTKPRRHTKEKKIEHIPLSPETIKLLESMQTPGATGPLFPGRNGGARVSLTRPWLQVCKAAGLVEAVTIKGKRGPLVRYRPTLRIHDLRHNFASHLVNKGVSLQIVGKLLGHSQIATTMRYSHLQDAALRDATGIFSEIYTDVSKRKTGTDAPRT